MRNNQRANQYKKELNELIGHMVNELIREEIHNLKSITLPRDKLYSHLCDMCGSYDFTTCNGPKYITLKTRHYIPRHLYRFLNAKIVERISMRINSGVNEWLRGIEMESLAA